MWAVLCRSVGSPRIAFGMDVPMRTRELEMLILIVK